MTACVSLFRGINVGGHHKVRMDELKKMHEALGLKQVLPYIQSGNVVFSSDDADVAHIQSRIKESFEHAFGFRVDVAVRTAAEIEEIIARNPFQTQPDKQTQWQVVLFLTAYPDATGQEDLLAAQVEPEELFLSGKELFIYYPNGIGRSKLTANWIEKKLKTTGTARNWNTVLQLRQLLQRVV
jgi:uncharacterized protein (DUF1697 family)